MRFSGGIDPELEREIRRLERRALRAKIPGENAFALNRAGDLCIQAGEPGMGVVYYGRAINHYLELDLCDAARAVCRKLLRVRPEAVRARSTLAWISIRSSLIQDAERQVEDYVQAAIRAAQEETATVHLRHMADATVAPSLREEIALHLMSLGEYEMADSLLERVYGDRNGLNPPHTPEDAEYHWTLALRTLIIRSDERVN